MQIQIIVRLYYIIKQEKLQADSFLNSHVVCNFIFLL